MSAVFVALLLALAPLTVRADDEPPPLAPGGAPAPTGPGGVPQVPAGAQNGVEPGGAAPLNAKITPGDHLTISVYGDPSLTNGNTIVQADGTIQYPLVGRVKVSGQTAAQAKDTITAALSKYLRHPVVSVAIAQQGVMNVLVMGNVRTTGRFLLPSGSHLTQAIAAAGGVAQVNGAFPMARVLQSDGTLQMGDLQKLFRGGDTAQNVALTNDATVYVTGAETIRVQVLGAVTRPGNVEVYEGDRLDMALARAGAEAQVKPDLNHVFVTRKDAKTGKDVSYQLDLYKALKQGDMRYDPVLQKDDRIYVPESRQPNATTIGIIGLLGRLFGL